MNDTYDYVIDNGDDNEITGAYEVTITIPPDATDEVQKRVYSKALGLAYDFEAGWDSTHFGNRSWDLGVCGSPVKHTYEFDQELAAAKLENQRETIVTLQAEVLTERETNSALRAQLIQVNAALDAQRKSRQFASGGVYPTTFPRTFTI